jgi:hypothetical protein
MRSVGIFLAAVVTTLALSASAGQGDEPKAPKKPNLMQQKLAAAQKLLEGLALRDFKMITENSDRLNQISKQAAWKMVETPLYEGYSNEFQRATLKIANHGRAKNLEGAALEYVDMTLTCVKCHEHVREVKIGKLPNWSGDRIAGK